MWHICFYFIFHLRGGGMGPVPPPWLCPWNCDVNEGAGSGLAEAILCLAGLEKLEFPGSGNCSQPLARKFCLPTLHTSKKWYCCTLLKHPIWVNCKTAKKLEIIKSKWKQHVGGVGVSGKTRRSCCSCCTNIVCKQCLGLACLEKMAKLWVNNSLFKAPKVL